MYPPGYRTFVEVTSLQDVLCGAARPGHFRGVATVVLKLFNLVQPDRAYFGQKDAQQVRIIQQMVRDLNVPVAVRVCPIVREADGLALSSRNQYLEADERRQALVLHRALAEARRRIEAGERDAAVVRQAMVERIASAPAPSSIMPPSWTPTVWKHWRGSCRSVPSAGPRRQVRRHAPDR